ncbi:MAG: hypothetical protein ABIT37_18330 [Luteolibacter sp.]
MKPLETRYARCVVDAKGMSPGQESKGFNLEVSKSLRPDMVFHDKEKNRMAAETVFVAEGLPLP